MKRDFLEDLKDPVLAGTLAILGAALVYLSGYYGFFRNELYFIVCGRHPDWGYADQPPLVPLIAAGTQIFGNSLRLLRLPGILAFLGVVAGTYRLTAMLGASRNSARLAALACICAPGLLGLVSTFETSSFETIAWLLLSICTAHWLQTKDSRTFLALGLIAGLALEAKYGVGIWILALLMVLLCFSERKIIGRIHFWIGIGICAAIAAPSIIWQAMHDFPLFTILHSRQHSDLPYIGSPVHFVISQFISMNLFLGPVWLAGMAGPFLVSRLRAYRMIAVAAVIAFAIILVTHGKSYYLFPLYPTLFAFGAATLERMPKYVTGTLSIVAAVNATIAMPLILPILVPEALQKYQTKLHLHPQPFEAAAVGAPLTLVFSDQFGWTELEKQVAQVYSNLPFDEQRRAVLFASNYGEASALNFFGPAAGLPSAISGNNQYYIWGPTGNIDAVIIGVGTPSETWSRLCSSVTEVGHFGTRWSMPYEQNRPIVVCKGLRTSLQDVWRKFQYY